MNEQASKNPQPIIRPLPAQVINKIAAGEVIERPAAVVKELVENSIDAGATEITIEIEKSGIKRIKIVDNGCGIPEEQIEIAFSRHATSKIKTFDDLESLYSYGFRGEALPSIASISRLRMVSRPHESLSGTEIIYEGGVLQSKQPIAASPGTQIEVENIFFNTPARRKFLKTETTEARHLSRTTMALAISRCDIGFTFTLNNRETFSLPPNSSLADRVAGVLGRKNTFVSVRETAGRVTVEGCVGTPDLAQHNRYGQFIFVNGRYIQSPTLSHALAAGYGELIPGGLFPVGALLITVPTTEVDVNVHPGKTEVRLSSERDIHEIVRHAVRDALRQDGIIPALKIQPHQSPPYPPSADRPIPPTDRTSRHQTVIPGIEQREQFDIHKVSELYRTSPAQPPVSARVDRETGEIIEEDTPSDIPSEPAPTFGPSAGFRLIGRFADLYLLLQAGDDLYIVDQHTAHERVLYEQMLDRIDRQTVHGQNLLFPVQVELTAEQFAVYEESPKVFEDSGFVTAPFGGRMVTIEAVPTVLSKKSPEKVFLKVLDDIASLRRAGKDLTKAMAQSIACRAAVMAGDRISDQEAVQLLDSLLRCDDKYSCPHGRPTFIKMGKADLDKQFGRGR